MSTWYCVTDCSDTPTPVEVESETAHFIKIKGERRRGRKVTDWRQYHPSLEQAEAAIAERKAKKAELDRRWRIRNAAPDMYEALKAVREECPADPDINADWYAAWQKLEAAIAKAYGSQS